MANKAYPAANSTVREMHDLGDGTHEQRTVLVGATGNVAAVDGLAGALVTQNAVHRMIHLGIMYDIGHLNEALADNGVIELLITTHATEVAHMRFVAAAGGDARITLFEAPTVTGAGTALTPVNRNRASSNTASTTVAHTPTTTADGTQLADYLLAAGTGGNSGGGNASSFEEYVLAAGTQYLFRVKNISGTAQAVGASIVFYEP